MRKQIHQSLFYKIVIQLDYTTRKRFANKILFIKFAEITPVHIANLLIYAEFV